MTKVVFDPGSPDVPSDSMHPLAERAFEIMEAAGIEQELIDEICEGINSLAGEANRECAACEQRSAHEEQRAWDEAAKLTPNLNSTT